MSPFGEANPDERDRLECAARLLRGTYHRRPRVRDLAAAAGMSRSHFHRRFGRHFGETPLNMIARLQIERATQLMRQGLCLREVGRLCGFSNHSHFSARIKQATGETPSRWLRVRGW